MIERNDLHQTYMNRHAYIWDNKDPFNGKLKHPWNDTSNAPPKKKPRKTSTKVKKVKKEKQCTPTATPAAPLMRFDTKTGSFTKYVDLTV